MRQPAWWGIGLLIVVTGCSAAPTPRHSASPTTPAAVRSAPPDPRAEAQHEVDALLAAAPLPPGSSRVSTDLTTGRFATIQGRINYTMSTFTNEIHAVRAYLGPGTVDGTVSYIEDHAPANRMLLCTACDTPVARFVYFAGTSGVPELDYNVIRFHGGVYMRVDVWTNYIPTRPSWSYVPADVTSVVLTVSRIPVSKHEHGVPTVRRTVTGRAARRLADIANTLPATLGGGNCGPPEVREDDVLVFHLPNKDLRLDDSNDGCGLYATTTRSRTTVYLKGAVLDAAVLGALDLRRDYGLAGRSR